jgi:hypothetical protein
MVYVLDTSPFIVIGHYFPDRFPSFWVHLNALADAGRLVSVSEVWKELDRGPTREHLVAWLKSRKALFRKPSAAEMEFVARIFAVPGFQALVKRKAILEGSPVADPWVIASAAVQSGCVVTEESEKPGRVDIPSVCRHFEVECIALVGMMTREGWTY